MSLAMVPSLVLRTGINGLPAAAALHAKRRLFRPRLVHVSPFAQGNPLAEARLLNRAGYSSAAVAMARMAVERRLLDLIRTNPKITSPRKIVGVGTATTMLVAVNAIDREEVHLLEKFGLKANKIVHGSPTTRLRARAIILQAAKALRMLEKKGGAS